MAPHTVSIRPCAQAGRFYPFAPAELRAEVEAYLGAARTADGAGATPPLPGWGEGSLLRALIAPHAGYIFSGSTAGRAFALLRGEAGRPVRRVIVLAPAHTLRFRGVASHAAAGFETPLGVAPLDREFLARLEERYPFVRPNEAAHRQEHAIEVEIPFLQAALGGGFRLVPLVLWDQGAEACRRLAGALAQLIEEEEREAPPSAAAPAAPATARGATLIVASSDLYHGPSHKECLESDQRTIRLIESGDAEGLIEAVEAGGAMACGYGPVAAALMAARALGADRVHALGHTTSADQVPLGRDYVVGYLSAAVYSGGKRKEG